MSKLIIHITIGIVSFCSNNSLVAQVVDNAGLYQKLIEQDLSARGNQINQLQGTVYQELIPVYEQDSLAGNMIIGIPNIQYTRLGSKSYLRSFNMSITRQGSSVEVQQYKLTDTLSSRRLKMVLAKSPKALRGDNPTIWGRLGKPVTIIAGSAGAIILLFFIRSS